MAEGKNTFVFRLKWKKIFDELDENQAGKLIKHLLAYVSDENPEANEFFIKLAFAPMKQDLKEDLSKWKDIKKKRAEAGKKGGKKTQAKAKQANASFDNQKQANQAEHDYEHDYEHVISSSNEEDVYYATDVLKKKYLENQKLCNAIIENQKLKSLHQLSELLNEFNKQLQLSGINSKTWEDYSSHFLNWIRKKSTIINQQQNNSSSNIPIG